MPKFLFNILLCCATLNAWGAATPDKSVIQKEIDTLVGKHVPISSIQASPVEGMYQVVAGARVFYTTQDGDYLFYGHLIDMTQKEPVSLSDQAEATARLQLLSKISTEDMIIYKATDKTKAVLTFFMDIDCGYCRQLHKEIPQLNAAGIEVRYLAFPRAGVGSDSYQKALAVWCAKDPQEAMNEAMQGERVVTAMKCDKDKVLQSQLQLVDEFGLQVTPVMVLENGQLVPGYLPAPQLIGLVLSK